MNPWQVVWDAEAEDQLAALWLVASDRAAITDAQAAADRRLSHDPSANGRHLSEGLYALDAPPLVLTYTIDNSSKTVTVTSVRRK